MKTILLLENPLDMTELSVHEAENVLDFVMNHFPTKPENLHIYHESISLATDVTPTCEEDFAKFDELPGPFYVVTYPEAAIPLIYWAYAAIALLVIALAVVVSAKTTIPTTSVGSAVSPNNSLSDRTNSARPNARIPDIFGTVRSTPDLIALPYKIFIDNIEVEISYMCIGRGSYFVSDICDDTTAIADIDGAYVAIYPPNNSPNSVTPAPQLVIGTDTTDPVHSKILDIVRYTSVNGQELLFENSLFYDADNDIQLEGPNKIVSINGNVDFTSLFSAGDRLSIQGTDTTATVAGHGDLSFQGIYTVATVSGSVVTLLNPSVGIVGQPGTGNSNWNFVTAGVTSGTFSPEIQNDSEPIIGPFIMPKTDADFLVMNFVADNGFYIQDTSSGKIKRLDATLIISATPVDASNNPTGPVEFTTAIFSGGLNANDTGSKALTVNVTLGTHSRYSVSVLNSTISLAHVEFYTIVGSVKWRDMYAGREINKTDFGAVTTVKSITHATEGALAVKERKLNMLVTRMLPARVSGSTFGALTATNSAADVFSYVCLDPFIGGRNVSEIDFDSVYDAIQEVNDYFGPNSRAAEFCYTFDDDSLSFEDTLAYIADAAFCTAFRRGNILQLSFEKKTNDSVLLFNHRNKVPNSETRTVRFGNEDNVDGITYNWVDPLDDSTVIYYIPEDQSATNPKEVKSVGIRNENQAYIHAYRAWNKIRYQNTTTEFTGTQVADMLVRNDRILVADNTRTGTIDGEIVSQTGLTIELSQPIDVTPAGSEQLIICLQLYDGTVQMIFCSYVDEYHLLLAEAPRIPLVVDRGSSYATTTYIVTWNSKPREQAFLVTERESENNMTSKITAINYDSRYYDNDLGRKEHILPVTPGHGTE